MNKFFKFRLPVLTAICCISLGGYLSAQSYKVQTGSKAFVDGTSTLHNWTSEVKELSGEIAFLPEFLQKSPASGNAISQVNLKFKVESMDGGRGATMNNKIFAALQATSHPYITFQSTAPVVCTGVKDAAAKVYNFKAKGNLTIGGVAKAVEVLLEGKPAGTGQYQFSGSHSFKMSDFNIEPPSAMFGQIVCGDDVTFRFELVAAP